MTDLAAKTAEVFRRINAYAKTNGYAGGFPVFHEAWFNGRKVLGAYMINPDQADCRLISEDFLKDAYSETDLFQAVCEASQGMGYAFGFPTFESVVTESGVLYQAVCIRHLSGEYRLLEACELGLSQAQSLGRTIRQIHEYAHYRGFKTGFPYRIEQGDGTFRTSVILVPSSPFKWTVLTAAEVNI